MSKNVQILSAMLVMLCLGQNVQAAEGEFSVLYVPNRGQEDTYVPVEPITPGPEALPRARAAMRLFGHEVGKYLHPAERGYHKTNLAKCEVMVFVPTSGEWVFRVVCWSVSLEKGIMPFEQWGEFGSPAEVLQFVREFSRVHFGRVRAAILRRSRGPAALVTAVF